MHELSIAHSLVSTVVDAIPVDAGTVREVRVSIGAMSGVVPQALEFAYDVAAAGTPLEDAALHIERIPVTFKCVPCDTVVEVPGEGLVLRCPTCQELSAELITGRELQVVSVTFDEAEASVAT